MICAGYTGEPLIITWNENNTLGRKMNEKEIVKPLESFDIFNPSDVPFIMKDGTTLIINTSTFSVI